MAPVSSTASEMIPGKPIAPRRVADGIATSITYNEDWKMSVLVAYIRPSVGSKAMPVQVSSLNGTMVPRIVSAPDVVSICMNWLPSSTA